MLNKTYTCFNKKNKFKHYSINLFAEYLLITYRAKSYLELSTVIVCSFGFYPNTKCPPIIKQSVKYNQTLCSFTSLMTVWCGNVLHVVWVYLNRLSSDLKIGYQNTILVS